MPKETCPYDTVLFWVHSEGYKKCPVLLHLEIVKKEVACLGVDIKIDVKPVLVPNQYLHYFLAISSDFTVENCQLKLGDEDEKQLIALPQILHKRQLIFQSFAVS